VSLTPNIQYSSSELIERLLKLILDMGDPERAFIPFAPSDEYAFLVNNIGGTSTLEICAIADATLLQPSKVLIPS
jgi:dihydroxyacetone kinase